MTQIKISVERRKFIKSIVANAYEHFNNPKLPLEVKALARSYSNIRLISYSKHMKRMNLPYSYMTNIAKDSYTDYYANMNMYYIYYNDIDYNIVTSNRYRWNIAHELGHVLLQHLSENQKTRLSRPGLSEDEYLLLEDEADYFAQLILVPHAALLGFKVDSARNIRVMCKISDPAAKRRFYDFQIWKTHVNASDEYDNRIFHYYYDFIFKRKCNCCGTGLVQRYGKHCPICGSKNTLNWGDGNKMEYPLLETYENNKLAECPICKNEETDIDGDFCQICGMELVNKCSDNCHTESLASNARYCPICGSKSTFFANGILKAWNYRPNTFGFLPDGIDEELPFN